MENKKINIKAELATIRLSLTDDVTNPNFEVNRKFALNRLQLIEDYFNEDKIREDHIKLLNYYSGVIDYEEHGIIVDEWYDIVEK